MTPIGAKDAESAHAVESWAKGISALFAAAVSAAAFCSELPLLTGPWATLVGFTLSLYLVFLGWFERRNQHTFIRALAWVFLVIGPVAVAYFGCVTLTIGFGESPRAIGHIVATATDSTKLASFGQPDELTGEYAMKISRHVDTAKAVFAVADNDRARVRNIIVKPFLQASLQIAKEVREDSREDAVLVFLPTPGTEVNMHITAALQMGSPRDPVSVIVSYEFARKDLVWRAKRWIFAKYQ